MSNLGLWCSITLLLTSYASTGYGALPPPGFYENSKNPVLIQLIQNTQSRLQIEIYEMKSPLVRGALRDALARGVMIEVIQEPNPVDGTCKIFDPKPAQDKDPNAARDCNDLKSLVKEVNASGGKYIPFTKSALCIGSPNTCLEHGKLVLADFTTALVSTGNFNSTSICDLDDKPDVCNRDYSIIVNQPESVAVLKEVFENDLKARPYDLNKILEDHPTAKITVSPLSLDPLISLIKSAKKSIWIQNQYLKDPTLNQAIQDAAGRGVSTHIMVASACAFGTPSASAKKSWTKLFNAWDQSGVESSIFTKSIRVNSKPGYLHAKAMVIDEKYAWVGSVNGSTQALSSNREFGVFFEDPASVQSLFETMQSDQSDPESETWQESLDCLKDDIKHKIN